MTEKLIVKDPYITFPTMLCGHCGSVLYQSTHIVLEPVPHVIVECLADHCEQKHEKLAVKLQKPELL